MRRLAALGIAGLVLAGCGPQANTFVPPPPPEVTVSQPTQQVVTDYLEYTGRTEAGEEVEIRARVQGFIDKIQYRDGQRVKQGEELFVIDPRPFKAAVDQAKGELEGKEAAFQTADVQFKQMEDAYKKGAASQYEYLNKKAQRDVTSANIVIAKAQLEEAQLNLEYTSALAPTGGKVNKAAIEVGSLVSVGTLLTTVVNDDRIYAYFEISEMDLLAARKQRNGGASAAPDTAPGTAPGTTPASAPGAATAPAPTLRVEMALVGEEGYPHGGVLDYIANKVNPSTGTIRVRGVFENPDRMLISGLFVRVRIPMEEHPAMLVPEVALGADQAGQYVLVVGKDNMVERRPVKVAGPVGTYRQVSAGLQGSERVVVNGILRARPGARVTPIQAEAATRPAVAVH